MCKNCECHEYLSSRGLGFNGDYRSKGHWCMYKIHVKTPDDIKAVFTNHKPISIQEYKDTPSWCPKELQTYTWDGIECKVIEVKSGIIRR
jgi:hypothetical protein